MTWGVGTTHWDGKEFQSELRVTLAFGKALVIAWMMSCVWGMRDRSRQSRAPTLVRS